MAKVSLLTIGNEVVDGQIVNRNAAWVSQALTEMGFEMDRHLSVKDDLAEITEALEYLAQTSQLILTTGGLGPTVDDRTRQALAQFLMTDLELYNEEWQEIQKKLSARQVPVRPEHMQQAYAPKGSVMLANAVGVAPGFFNSSGKVIVAALPGPPNELQTIWKNSLHQLLMDHLQPKHEQMLQTWVCFGAAESEVQHRVRPLFSQVALDYGFRLHKPYVELKAWHKASEQAKWQDFFSEVERVLGPWYVGSTIAQVRRPFTEKIGTNTHLKIFDGLTQGLLLDKIKEAGVRSDATGYYTDRFSSLEADRRRLLEFLGEGRADYRMALFPKDELTATMYLNDKIEDITTYRNIPAQSSLGKLVIIEKIFARGL